MLPRWAKPLWANTLRKGKEMEEGRKEREAARKRWYVEEREGEISDEPDSMSRLAPGVVNYDNTHTKTTTTINIEEMKK